MSTVNMHLVEELPSPYKDKTGHDYFNFYKSNLI